MIEVITTLFEEDGEEILWEGSSLIEDGSVTVGYDLPDGYILTVEAQIIEDCA